MTACMQLAPDRMSSTDHAASDFWCGVLLGDTSAVQAKAEVEQKGQLPSIPEPVPLQQQQQQVQQVQLATWVPQPGPDALGQDILHWPETQHPVLAQGDSFDSADPTMHSTSFHMDWQHTQQDQNPLHNTMAWLDLGPGMHIENSLSNTSAPSQTQEEDICLARGDTKHARRMGADRRRHSHEAVRPPGSARPARTEQERVERRMAKNRATAAASRQRRKALQADLITRTSELEGENSRLMDLVLSKDAEIATLRDQISAAAPA